MVELFLDWMSIVLCVEVLASEKRFKGGCTLSVRSAVMHEEVMRQGHWG